MATVPVCIRTSPALIRRLCPPRRPDSHKGDYGRVLIVAGAEGFTGAPVLAARAALRAGAGLIFTAVPRAAYPIVAWKLDAPMVLPLPDDGAGKLSCAALPELLARLETADACLLGPGLGRSAELDRLVAAVIDACRCPLILDADGINAVAAHRDKLRGAACPLILTPHEGEFRRLWPEPETSRLQGAMALARETGAVVLRKGHETLITDGRRRYVNRTGNPGMATGGSGDALAGILLALLGQGAEPLEAAAAAAWLHGRAGDRAAARRGQYGLAPGDLIEALPRLLP